MSYVVGLVLSACLTVTYAAVMQGVGPCPDGHVSGESWYEPNCGKCDCGDSGYSCYGCGVFAVEYDRTTCYLQTNDSANYPDCCTPELYCIGDAGFDKSKLQPPSTTASTKAPVKKTTPKPTPKPTRKPAPRATPKPAPRPTPKPVPKPAQKPQVNRRG